MLLSYRKNEKALNRLIEKAKIDCPEIANQLQKGMNFKYDYRTLMEDILDALLADLHDPNTSLSVLEDVVNLNKSYLDLKDFLLKVLSLDERDKVVYTMQPSHPNALNMNEKLTVILNLHQDLDLKYASIQHLDIFNYCAISMHKNDVWKKYIDASPNKKHLLYQSLHNFCSERNDLATYFFSTQQFTVEDFFVLAKKIKENKTPLKSRNYSQKKHNVLLDYAFFNGFQKTTKINPHQIDVLMSKSYAERFPKTHALVQGFELERKLKIEIKPAMPPVIRRTPSPGRF